MRTTFIGLLLLSLAAGPALTPLQAKGPNHLQAALNAATSGPTYSYTLDYRSDEFRGKARVHPSRAKGKRVVMIVPSLSKLDADQLKGVKEVDQDASKAFWCHSFAKRIPARTAKLVNQTGATATYTFKPVHEADDADDAKMMKHLVGTVTVSKSRPAILSFALDAPKSFKPVFVARIKSFALRAGCSRSPDGRTYVSRFDLNVSGSAMMRSFEERQSRIHTQLVRAGS